MRRLFVLSVDSLFYDDMGWLKDCPNLSAILAAGSQVERVQSVYPAMTYAAHATMLTGCYPDVHGIYHNEKVQVDNPHPEWHWRRAELKVPTLLDAAYTAGYTSCVVNWPVTGADPHITYDIPEIWSDEPGGDGRPRFVQVCSPGIETLYDRYSHLLRWKYQPELDEFGTCCLLDVIRDHQPEVILLHLSYLDHARHAHGAFSPEAREALQACDARFGRVAGLLKQLGLYDATNFVVVGDHGHLPVRQVFHPNILFREHGLLDAGETGRVTSWKAYCHSAGLSAHVVLADPADEAVRRQVEALLQSFVADESLGVEQVFTARQAREQWHLAGPFQYVLESREGTAFGNRCTGPLLQQADNSDYKISVSAHGHLPTKGPQPTFFAAGPQVRPGVTVARGRLIDEAPTWAALLGLTMPAAQGRPVRELLRD